MNYRWHQAADGFGNKVHAIEPRKRTAVCGVRVKRRRPCIASVLFCNDCNRLIAKEKK